MNILYQIESVFLDVFIAFAPLILFFTLFQVFYLKMNRLKYLRILRSMLVAYLGMSLFIMGVNISFLTSGSILGRVISENYHAIWLVVIGMVFGVLVTLAEPAVKILNIEIEKETSGYISGFLFTIFLALGVGFAVGLSLLRILLDIPFLWFIIGLYAIIFLLMIKSSKTFTALAFDSGGVVTGPMIATFIMAFTVGAATILSDQPSKDGFGMIAFVAAVPIITILLLGYLYQEKS